jgi:hypothetical protein
VPGKFVSIDEQTIGFKGKHGLTLRISYKREGEGYTFHSTSAMATHLLRPNPSETWIFLQQPDVYV